MLHTLGYFFIMHVKPFFKSMWYQMCIKWKLEQKTQNHIIFSTQIFLISRFPPNKRNGNYNI